MQSRTCLSFTRAAPKKHFLRAWKLFFCRTGLVWVSHEQCRKEQYFRAFFWQSRTCLSFTRAVPKKQLFRAWFFLQSRACLSFTRAVPKKIEPYLFLQSRACLSFHKSMCRRSIFWDPDFFWQSRACLSFTRAVPKKIVRAWFFFANPGLSEFHESGAQKTIVRSLKNCFSAKPKFSSSSWGKQCFRFPSLSTYKFWVDWKQPKHARKKQFFGAWKIVFLQSLSFLQVIGENNVSGSQVYPHIDFEWFGSSPSMREKKSELENLFFCKARFHPIRP